MRNSPELTGPGTDACVSAYEWVFANTPAYVANHSLRSYRFTTHLAPLFGVPQGAYDDELVYLSCVLHDVGLTDHADHGQRFEVDGADFAKAFLIGIGLADDRADTVWQAVALHTSVGIASRMRPEIALTHAGIGCDILGFFAPELGDRVGSEVHDGLPRHGLGEALAVDVVGAARTCADKAPPFSFPAWLVAEAAPELRPPSWAEMIAANRWNSLG